MHTMNRLSFVLGFGMIAFSVPQQAAPPEHPPGDPADPGPKPERNEDGTYDCMLKSMQDDEVTEPQASKITKWGVPERETWKQHTYWAIPLEYQPITVFGKPVTQVRALVRHNKVHFWLYVGSNEIVP